MKNLAYGIAIVFAIVFFICSFPPRHHSDWSGKKRLRVINRLKRRRDALNERLSKIYYGGTQCPLCFRWPWESDKDHSWSDTTQPAVMTCGTCGHKSYWVDGPGVMIPVAPPSTPIYIGE